MIYKTLIATDTFVKDTLPHLLITATGKNASFQEKEFTYRENKYQDLAGIMLLKKDDILDPNTISQMEQLVKTVNKNLICLISGDCLSGWLFFKESEFGEVAYRKIQAYTNNDVNFDVWLESQNSLWNPVDFLLEGAMPTVDLPYYEDTEVFTDIGNMMFELKSILERIEKKIDESKK